MIWMIVGLIAGITLGIILGGILSSSKMSDYEAIIYQLLNDKEDKGKQNG